MKMCIRDRVHSTPNFGQDNKIELNVTSEKNITDDSGIQITPKLSRESKINDDEVSFTDSKTESQSTPTLVKKENTSDMMNMMQLLLNKFDSNFEEQKSDSNIKYDKINANFNEIINEIKQQNININEIHEKVTESQKNIDEKLNEINVKLITTCLLYTSRCV